MDDYTEKRTAGVLEFCNESSGASFRDPKHEERNFDYFKRTGYSTRHGSIKRIQNCSPGKIKYLKPPVSFKSSNPLAPSSSRSICSSANLSLSGHESWKNLANNAECSNGQGKEEGGLKFDFESHRRNKVIDFSQEIKAPLLHSSPTRLTKTLSNSKVTSARRYGKQISQSCVCDVQDTVNSPFHRHWVPRISIQTPKSFPQSPTGRPQGYGLKSLGCASILEAFRSSSSSNGHNKRAGHLRKKFCDEESSTGMSMLLEKQVVVDTLRKTKAQYNSKDVTVSGKTCPTFVGESSRMRLNEREDEDTFQLPEPSLFPMHSHNQLTISEVIQERSQLSFVSQTISLAGAPWSSSRSSRHRSVSHSEGRDDYLGLNMEGIEEVLRALERTEQDEELTYEQLRVLEANLLEGFSFHDQHRDMRLDIDDMSYEDLLALEEKMGSVSTAIPEDSLRKCLKKTTYKSIHTRGISVHGDDDDIKCSICQEEYVIGEEVGGLLCKHHYHMECIHQWLRLKNWCPICKAPPSPSSIDQQF